MKQFANVRSSLQGPGELFWEFAFWVENLAKFPQVINMVKIIRTEFVIPVLGSKFLEYSHCDDHFVIALQKTSVFDENLYFWSLTNFKKVIFQKRKNEQTKFF